MCFPLVLGFGRWRAVLVRACLLVAGVQFDGLLSGQGLGMSVSSGRAAGREQAALGRGAALTERPLASATSALDPWWTRRRRRGVVRTTQGSFRSETPRVVAPRPRLASSRL